MSDHCDTCKEHEERSRRQVINRLLQSGNATPGGFMLYPPGIPFPCYSGDCPYINKTVSIEAHFLVCSCLLPSSTPRGGLHIYVCAICAH